MEMPSEQPAVRRMEGLATPISSAAGHSGSPDIGSGRRMNGNVRPLFPDVELLTMSDFHQNVVVALLHRLGQPNLQQLEARTLQWHAMNNPITLICGFVGQVNCVEL
jgi:hypothetical protein